MKFNRMDLFSAAKIDSNYRQHYIDELGWKKSLPFVNKINYIDSQPDSSLMIRVKKLPSELFKSIIDVDLYPHSFNFKYVSNNENDFKHNLYNYIGYIAAEQYLKDKDIFSDMHIYWKKLYGKSFDTNCDSGLRLLLNDHRALQFANLTLNFDRNSEEYVSYLEDKISMYEDAMCYYRGKKSVDKLLENNYPLSSLPLYYI